MTEGPDFASVAAALRDLPRVKLRELHCAPDVAARLRESIPDADPLPPGTVGQLTAVPVIENPGLEPGEWNLRENGAVIRGCFRAPDGNLYEYAPAPFEPLELSW